MATAECGPIPQTTTRSVDAGEIVSRSTIGISVGNKDGSQIVTRGVATNIETYDKPSARSQVILRGAADTNR